MEKLFAEIRAMFMNFTREKLEEKGEDVLQVASNELSIPWKTEDGTEGYLNITFRVPKGARGGDPYDGYIEAEGYNDHVEMMAQKAKERAELKAKKIKQRKEDEERGK